MGEPLSIIGMVAGVSLREFVSKMFEHVCGGIAHHKVNEVIERAARRFTRGELPRNHHLEESLYLALGQAARVLAYELHDPERGPLCDLLQSLSSWPQFLVRLCEIAQNN